MCYVVSSETDGDEGLTYDLSFISLDRPEWVRQVKFQTLPGRANVVGAVYVETLGRDVAEQVISAAIKKFGAPGQRTVSFKENAFGARVPFALLRWHRGAVTIELETVADRATTGWLTAWTRDFNRARSKQRAIQRSREAPL